MTPFSVSSSGQGLTVCSSGQNLPGGLSYFKLRIDG